MLKGDEYNGGIGDNKGLPKKSRSDKEKKMTREEKREPTLHYWVKI